jgi:hypothetical protein
MGVQLKCQNTINLSHNNQQNIFYPEKGFAAKNYWFDSFEKKH